MSKVQFAKALKCHVRSVTAYEAGEWCPDDTTVQTMSRVLGFPRSFFEASDIETPNPSRANFRALTRMTAGQRDSALAAGALAKQISHWIEARFRLPAVDVPTMTTFEPEPAADALRAQWGLGERPVRNVLHLLEAHGVRVFSLPAECVEFDAFSLWDRGIPYIFLNPLKSGEHGRFDASHELGHLVLHRDGGPRGTKQAEWEADQFASAFLMPRASVLACAAGRPSLNGLIKLKRNWKVSVAALVHRLRKVDILSDWNYRSLCIELSQRGYRTSEPDGIARETSQLLQKVFAALRADGVSRTDIAREMHLHADELDCLIFGLAIAAVPGKFMPVAPAKSKPQGQLRLV